MTTTFRFGERPSSAFRRMENGAETRGFVSYGGCGGQDRLTAVLAFLDSKGAGKGLGDKKEPPKPVDKKPLTGDVDAVLAREAALRASQTNAHKTSPVLVAKPHLFSDVMDM